ncbi:hypothetical protein J4405_05465 [Candidatus Woesearchaeota archaeon]|nr:hypothetical protein [Candidatus Woesearchaeota archaeon]
MRSRYSLPKSISRDGVTFDLTRAQERELGLIVDDLMPRRRPVFEEDATERLFQELRRGRSSDWIDHALEVAERHVRDLGHTHYDLQDSQDGEQVANTIFDFLYGIIAEPKSKKIPTCFGFEARKYSPFLGDVPILIVELKERERRIDIDYLSTAVNHVDVCEAVYREILRPAIEKIGK